MMVKTAYPGVSDEAGDVKMLVLKCPNCGGSLRVSPGTNQARCDHCATDVLIVGAGKAGIQDIGGEADAVMKVRAVKAGVFGTMIAVVLPFLINIGVFLIIGVVFVVLGIVMFFMVR